MTKHLFSSKRSVDNSVGNLFTTCEQAVYKLWGTQNYCGEPKIEKFRPCFTAFSQPSFFSGISKTEIHN